MNLRNLLKKFGTSAGPLPTEKQKEETPGPDTPIDAIYTLLKEDYEAKGYEDALCNPDHSYKDMNKTLIKSGLEIKLKQAQLSYTDYLREIDFHIDSRSKAGLMDVSDQLKTRKEILEKHVSLLKDMEKDLHNEAPYMLRILLTYERGFLKGLTAASLEILKPKQL